MAITTRVLFVSATTHYPNQCHKCSPVAKSIPLPVSSSSLTLSSSYSTSSLSLPTLRKTLKGVKRVGIRTSPVVAMAQSSKTTVLVTGAGGRTGLIFLCFAFMGFVQILFFCCWNVWKLWNINLAFVDFIVWNM